jgi:SET domain-containing protein
VSIANNSTFTNHACTEDEANVHHVDDLFTSEDGDDIGFSPLQVRFADLVGVLARATRDVAAGEEIHIDYATFRSYPESDSFHMDLLGQICNSGVGMVAPDDGDLLLGLGGPTAKVTN